MNRLEYLAQLGGCKRDVVRVAGKVGGLMDCVFTGLCGALPEAKGKGGVQATKYLKYSNMKKEFLIFVVAVMFAAFGCGSRQAGSNADAAIVEVDESWFGVYSHYSLLHPHSSGVWYSQSADLEITPDTVVFTVDGFHHNFVALCSVEETALDVLTFSFQSLIDGRILTMEQPHLLILYRKDGKYYFNSPYIAFVGDSLDSSFNTDVEAVRDGQNPQPVFFDDIIFEDKDLLTENTQTITFRAVSDSIFMGWYVQIVKDSVFIDLIDMEWYILRINQFVHYKDSLISFIVDKSGSGVGFIKDNNLPLTWRDNLDGIYSWYKNVTIEKEKDSFLWILRISNEDESILRGLFIRDEDIEKSGLPILKDEQDE